MNISGSVVLVTGANRGIGAEFVKQLEDIGAAKIYAAARDASTLTASERVVPIELDVTNPTQIAAAAAQAGDVQIVINNAGIARAQSVIEGDLDVIRSEFETNFYGPLQLARAFAPALAGNGGGAILNVLSALSWISYPGAGGYSASKAAAWSLTDALRLELAAQGTQVVGLHMGAVDTDMGASFTVAKAAPEDIVAAALAGIEEGVDEVLADVVAPQVKSGLGLNPAERYAALVG
jgi:NAD(P)-dependent dehydrogenase (short-subunit alcohol dehydrogenase family)